MSFDQQFEHGMIVGGGRNVTFQWNPHQYKIHKSAKWAHLHAAGRDQPYLQYGCGEAVTYTLELYLSADGDKSKVKQQTEQLVKLAQVAGGGGMVDSPAQCTFISGGAVNNFKCIVEDVSVTWSDIFDPDTSPRYAKATVKLTEYK
jgi:hypothetical protein